TLEIQKNMLDQRMLDLLMTYNPEKAISLLHRVTPYTHDLIHLGNKGFNLVTLYEDNKPVPPAFIITTEVFRCREVIYGLSKARDEFMHRIRTALDEIEEQTGKVFGSSERPLLLSIRSGAAVSMPGMMATIHNVGLNEEIIEEYVRAHGEKYLTWDNYRRFLQSWAMTSGMQREDFQDLMNRAKARHGVNLKREFTPEQMRELALEYQQRVRRQGLGIPEDPWLQLVNAVTMVLDSWQTVKAADYRRIMDVSDAWGTAVIVQAMVFGNRSDSAGSGVLFTSHPYRKVQRVALWGDYAYGDQGEDIVSGLVTSLPVSVEQAELDGRSVDETLERRFPLIYERLLAISRDLVYEKRWDPQEIEFTFEGPEPERLFLLQTRDMITIKKKEHFNVFAETAELERSFLGKGIGVSGSALAGRAVFTEENILELRVTDPQMPLILIRQDTVPEDIKVIDMAEGLLTSRGGQTSHASVVAVRLEKTCVVGCKQLKVYEAGEYCEIGTQVIRFGDPVSIDGRKGLLLAGMHPIQEEMHILPL
ncbi:MAG: phosphoenolpyruvate synthase, partial [Proteobacteria bacterium]|nr:phosphoenolpyruvate synthase [Pseudomonadota bacterium]